VSRRTFDLIILTVILTKPAFGLVKMAARRWSNDSNGAMGTIGDAVTVAL
jgi:hypothetical protein